ncbi:hypothetical protein CF326_g1912 [Tilletia indica]|nr:hypothetical protein CF326_g1912 [Tilletia indica]
MAALRLLSASRTRAAPSSSTARAGAAAAVGAVDFTRCSAQLLGPQRRSWSASASAKGSSTTSSTATLGSSDALRMRNSTRGFRQELPRLPNRRPLFLALAVLGVGGWVAFAQFATNKERLSSSAFRSALVQVKDSPAAQDALGDPIMLVPSLVGDPWISGSVNTMQGRVDLSFEVKGAKGKGRAYFTSIRQASHLPFEIIRFLLVTDNGDSISLLPD